MLPFESALKNVIARFRRTARVAGSPARLRGEAAVKGPLQTPGEAANAAAKASPQGREVVPLSAALAA